MPTENKKMPQIERHIMIDFLRGLGILLMIIFHFVFDLNFSRVFYITFLNNPLWIGFGRLILTIFLICVGMGLALAHKTGIQWSSVKKRFHKIFLKKNLLTKPFEVMGKQSLKIYLVHPPVLFSLLFLYSKLRDSV